MSHAKQSKKALTILVDMDGVLADFDGRFMHLWAEKYPNRPQLDQSRRTSFKIVDEFSSEDQDDIRAIFSARGFFRELPVILGAVEGIRDMQAGGMDVWICTSPLNEYRNCVLEKFEWIEEHLGPSWVSRLILAKNKALIRGDYLIDDNPSLPFADTARWKQLLFDAPYNRLATHLPRVTWANLQGVLRPIPPHRENQMPGGAST